jgi:hypothetical protein
VPADLDQFWGNNSHGTVVGGKRLIELGHGAADGRAFFNQVNIVSRFSQIQSRLHTRNTTAHNQNRSYRSLVAHFCLPVFLGNLRVSTTQTIHNMINYFTVNLPINHVMMLPENNNNPKTTFLPEF